MFLLTHNFSGERPERAKLETIQNLILRGKRDEAVEHAVDSNNFALALLVGAYCGGDTFGRVMKQYADKVLRIGSPLYTITMLFSSKILDSSAWSSMWAESSDELLSSWPYHLAAIISNRTDGWERIVFYLGNRLQQLGDTNAAHFCYMVSGLQLSSPTLPHTYVSLLGCDHLLPEAIALMSIEGIEAFERTEAYEWAKRRGNRSAVIKTLQPYKLYYAMLLADAGYVEPACKYVETILRMCDLEGDSSRFDCASPAKATLPEMCESFDAFKGAVGYFEQRLFRSFPVEASAETKRSPSKIVEEELSPQMTASSPPPHMGNFQDIGSPDGANDMSFMTAATHLQDTTMLEPPSSQSQKKEVKLARVTRKKQPTMDEVPEEPTEQEPIPRAPQSGPPSTQVASGPPVGFQTPAAVRPPSSSPATKDRRPAGSTSSQEKKKPEPSPKSAPAVMSSTSK